MEAPEGWGCSGSCDRMGCESPLPLAASATGVTSREHSREKFLSSDPDKTMILKENGFSNNSNSFRYPGGSRDDILPVANTSNEFRYMSERVDSLRKPAGSVTALKELCTVEGYSLVFQEQPSRPDGSSGKEAHAQVEIGGQILGKGVGATWEQAKLQAADEALGNLSSMLGIFAHKSSGFQRSSVSNLNRLKDYQWGLQTVPSGWDSRNSGRVL